MTCKNLIVAVLLLSVFLGVDAEAAGRSPRKTEKLYRKAGKWQRKLRDVWALLGVKPFLVQPGEEGDECVLKSKVEETYVLKTADVFTQADVDAAKGEGCVAGGGTWDADTTTCAAAAGGYDLMCEANDCPLRTDGCPGKEHCLVGPNPSLITWVGLTACTLSKDGEVVASNCEK